MKKIFVTLLSLVVVTPLLILLFAVFVAALVLACVLADSAMGAVGVLAFCCVGAVAIALLVSHVCRGNTLQARQLLRENTAALVGVIASMIAIGSACTLVGFGSIAFEGDAALVRILVLLPCLAEAVLCCMMGKRLLGYMKRTVRADVQELRKEVRTLLLLSLVLSVVEFGVSLFALQRLNIAIVQSLFEDLSVSFGDLVWLELVFSCIKIAAAASGVILTYRRKTAKQAVRQQDSSPVIDLMPKTDATSASPNADAALNKDALAA